MDAITALYLIAALLTKHLVCDFPLQWAYQYRNKGIYGHPGGLLHASIHMVGAVLAMIPFSIPAATIAGLMLVDGIVHYHMDWLKVRINAKMGWKPDNSEQFWWLLGFDQWVHCMTYVFMVWYLV